METLTNYLSANPILIVVSSISTMFLIASILIGIVEWVAGISPIIFRLGLALRKRKIMVFGSDKAYSTFKDTILDSKIFKEKNIIHIRKNNLSKAKNESLFLVDWETSKNQFNKINQLRKNHQTAIIIFAKHRSIDNKTLNKIGNLPNTTIVNFRGRLLNDLVAALITSNYE